MRAGIKAWYGIAFTALFYTLLSYLRRLLSYFQIEGAALLSKVIIWSGIPVVGTMVLMMFVLSKKYPDVTNAVLWREKPFRRILITMCVLSLIRCFI